MNKPETLNELKQLKESGFGRPYPRHGLKLLYWFANNCLYFDNNNNMRWKYDPKKGHFGFKFFENRDKLLPDVNLDYYEVGNLSKSKFLPKRRTTKLPRYVWKDYPKNGENCDRNKDRIIVSVDGKCFDTVYITEHIDNTRFNKDTTYRISWKLIMTIKDKDLEDFLSITGYKTLQEDSDQGTGYSMQQKDTDLNTGYTRLVEKCSDQQSWDNDENCCRCIIL